jgi:hypothetical protein
MNDKTITEISRIKELMQLNEQLPGSTKIVRMAPGLEKLGTQSTRTWIRQGIQKMGGEQFLDDFDNIFRSNPQTKKSLSGLKDDIAQFGDDAVKRMSDEEIELLLRSRDPDAFARFVMKSTKIGESMDTVFTNVDNLVVSGKKVDVDGLVTDLKAQLDEIEGIDAIPGLKDNMYKQIDESAEAAKRGSYNLERGLTSNVDLDVLLSAILKDSKVRGRLLSNNRFKLEMQAFIRENIGKTGDEIVATLQKSIDNHINSLTTNKDKFLEFIERREKNASDPAVLRALNNLKDIVRGKYGYSAQRATGAGAIRSFVGGPGKALLHAWVVDFSIGNIYNWLTGHFDDPESDIYFGFVPTLISLLVEGVGDLAKQIRRELTFISIEEAEKWAKEQEYLSNLIDDPKNQYVFTKENDDQRHVDMINFSDDENRDSDFMIMRASNNVHYESVDNSEEKPGIIDRFLEKLD